MIMACLFLKSPDIVFVQIPKNGGSYFTSVIKDFVADLPGAEILGEELRLPPHTSIREMVDGSVFDILGYESAPDIVGIVRNPWARLYSRFNFRRRAAQKRIAARLSLQRVKSGISMLDDLKIVMGSRRLGFNRWVLCDDTPRYADDSYFNIRDRISWLEGLVDIDNLTFIRFEHFTEDSKLLPEPLNHIDWCFRQISSSGYQEL
ncbi:MAG: hypothetical protein ABJ308_09980 [Halieaceae bacterium]